jgi:nucleoside-diphosphate-sugar epimerase
MNATSYLAPQHCHLMPERDVLHRKLALRPKGRSEQRQEKTEQREHGSLTVGDSPTKSTRIEFSVHTDVLHITADFSRLRHELDWRPRVDFAAGMIELAIA